MSLECARLALAALPRFAAAAGSLPIITLGSVAYDGVPILCADVENVAELRRRACYHVWWSFGDEQVIDLTLMAHLAQLQGRAAVTMAPIIAAPGGVARVRWRPYLVGEAIVGALVDGEQASP